MRRFARGLVVGKFAPLHLGHELVIERGLDECEELVVISYSNPEFSGCEPRRRAGWLAARFPGVSVLVVSDDLLIVNEREEITSITVPHNDASDGEHRLFCADLCREVLGVTVDAVFTSEPYGDGFAAELTSSFRGVEPDRAPVVHVSVDPDRRIVPVSGTVLRRDVHELRRYISPDVYASFVGRVCLLGGESTGKSTLAGALARVHKTAYVEEYGRTLWEERDGNLVYDDLLEIAKRQIALENVAARESVRYLFCDTSPLTTLFYSYEMFGKADPALVELAHRRYDLVALCAPDFDFVQDGSRRESSFRDHGHSWYLGELDRRELPYITLTGSVEERIGQVGRTLTGLG